MGVTELLYVMGGLVVLYIIGKLLGKLFGRSKRQTYYQRGSKTNYQTDQSLNSGGIEKKKKKWPYSDPFDNPGRKAAQNAQKNFDDMRKRNDNIRKQTDDTIRKMTKRSRGW